MRRILVGLALTMLAGCSQRGLLEGLVIETASVEAGLTGHYTRDGVTVRFAAIRGEANDPALDPGAPPFSVDARWSDDGHRAILLSGAEDLLPAAVSDEEVSSERRLLEIQLSVEAADLLSTAAEAAALAPELEALVGLAAVARSSSLVRAPEGEVTYACTIMYSHQLAVKYAGIWWSVGLAEHSAVGLWSYKRGTNCLDTLYGYKQSCNHGRCANDSSMSEKCSWASGWRSASWPKWYAEPSTSTGTVSGACLTPYLALDGHPSVHVCNDDTVIQVYGIKYNASYPSGQKGGTCSDGTLRMKAPGC